MIFGLTGFASFHDTSFIFFLFPGKTHFLPLPDLEGQSTVARDLH